MDTTRWLTIGTGLLLGSGLGAVAATTDWGLAPAQAQDGAPIAEPVRPDEREARAKKAEKLARAIAELRAGLEKALDRGEEKRADQLEEKLHKTAAQLRELVGQLREHDQLDALEMVERILTGRAGDRPQAKPRPDDRRDAPEWQRWEPERLHGELREAEQHLRELHTKLRAIEEKKRAAAEYGKEDAVRELGAAWKRTAEEARKVEEFLHALHGEAQRRERGGRGADGRPERNMDDLERRFHGLGEELERAHRNVDEYEAALHQARERGEEKKEAKLRAGLERLVDHIRELEQERGAIEAMMARARDERARGDDERRRRDLEERARDERGPGPRGEGMDDLRREIAEMRGQLEELRHHMAAMHDMLARLLEQGERGREPRRERDR